MGGMILPQETFGKVWRHFGLSQKSGRAVLLASWMKGRDIAEHRTGTKALSTHRMVLASKNVNRAKVEKTSCKLTSLRIPCSLNQLHQVTVRSSLEHPRGGELITTR